MVGCCKQDNEIYSYIKHCKFCPPEQPLASEEGLFPLSLKRKNFMHVLIIILRDLKINFIAGLPNLFHVCPKRHERRFLWHAAFISYLLTYLLHGAESFLRN